MNLLVKCPAGDRSFILPANNAVEVSFQSDVVKITESGKVIATIWQSNKSYGYDKIPQAVIMAMDLGDRSLIVDQSFPAVYDVLLERWWKSPRS